MGKPITFWANEEEEKMLRAMAKKENRSLSNFIKNKCEVFKKKEWKINEEWECGLMEWC